MFPCKRHPFGKIGNALRCHFTKRIVKTMGKKCLIEKGADIQEEVVLFDYSSVGVNALIQKGTIIKGHNMMGPNVKIFTTGHKYNELTHNFEGKLETKPVEIGEYSWLGYGVIVLPGVSIGRNTIIGAGSVVTKSIPSGVMAAGNPCIVKKIIDAEIYSTSTVGKDEKGLCNDK